MLTGSIEALVRQHRTLGFNCQAPGKPYVALVAAPNGPVQHAAPLFGALPCTSCSCCAGQACLRAC